MSRYLYALVGEDSFLQIEALQQIVRSLGNVQRTDFDGEEQPVWRKSWMSSAVFQCLPKLDW
ncbi:MAG: hypothetical protein KatS3mg104_3193 [Phycisphaerae bacterium]|nr:MAG: hypothetical protein KatS3mg104_3193 [Phycisphaerae bacterium]